MDKEEESDNQAGNGPVKMGRRRHLIVGNFFNLLIQGGEMEVVSVHVAGNFVKAEFRVIEIDVDFGSYGSQDHASLPVQLNKEPGQARSSYHAVEGSGHAAVFGGIGEKEDP